MTIRIKGMRVREIENRRGSVYTRAVAPDHTIEETNERQSITGETNGDRAGLGFDYWTGFDVTKETSATSAEMNRRELRAEVTTTPANQEIALTARRFEEYDGADTVTYQDQAGVNTLGTRDLPINETPLFVDNSTNQLRYLGNIVRQSVTQNTVYLEYFAAYNTPEFNNVARTREGTIGTYNGRNCVVEHRQLRVDEGGAGVFVIYELNLETGVGYITYDSGFHYDSGWIYAP